MRKLITSGLAILGGAILVAAMAAAILVTTLLASTSAATQPPGTTIIGSGSMCLRGATHSGVAKMAACNPARRSQWWVVTKAGRYQLAGTREYAVASTAGVALGPWVKATTWVYDSDHQVLAGTDFLTQTGSGEPFLDPAPMPAPDQVWYEFEKTP